MKIPDIKKVKSYLRSNAPEVKGFEIDNLFNVGSIKTLERVDLGPKGYRKVERTYKDFDALKEYYGDKVSKPAKRDTEARGSTERPSTRPTKTVARKVAKGRVRR